MNYLPFPEEVEYIGIWIKAKTVRVTTTAQKYTIKLLHWMRSIVYIIFSSSLFSWDSHCSPQTVKCVGGESLDLAESFSCSKHPEIAPKSYLQMIFFTFYSEICIKNSKSSFKEIICPFFWSSVRFQ